MTIGMSLFLIAVGAILKFAVSDSLEGVDLGTIGVILMVVGIVGLVLGFLYESMWRDRTRSVVRRDRYVDRDPYA